MLIVTPHKEPNSRAPRYRVAVTGKAHAHLVETGEYQSLASVVAAFRRPLTLEAKKALLAKLRDEVPCEISLNGAFAPEFESW